MYFLLRLYKLIIISSEILHIFFLKLTFLNKSFVVKNWKEKNESSGKPRNKVFFTLKIVTHQHFLLPSFFPKS